MNNNDEANEVNEALKKETITSTSGGKAILDAIKKIRKQFNLVDDRPDLVIIINQAINDAGGKID